jgi:hypothetical protein
MEDGLRTFNGQRKLDTCHFLYNKFSPIAIRSESILSCSRVFRKSRYFQLFAEHVRARCPGCARRHEQRVWLVLCVLFTDGLVTIRVLGIPARITLPLCVTTVSFRGKR